MREPRPGEPWAYIAHKDGKWAGVAAANLPRKDLSKFLGGFAAEGFAITTVYSRDEYNAVLKPMGMWRRPKPAKTSAPDLFALTPPPQGTDAS